MSLLPGTRIGAYEVIARIGAGGMGEVYRAIDTNLKRQVALKVLPALVAGDADRLARFQREAEVLAALNHPNIAQIYGVEKSATGTALVMELVEGEDLSQRLSRGAIPLDEALPIAKQIAEGLEAAHGQGILHRDLKPANIKVRSDGTVKVLDFGLAKALEPAGASHDASQSPTITSPAMLTSAGMILGTAAYMSPEQAKGRTADRQSDIWAFGCVLFEMLAGRRSFDGEDVADTMAAVLRGDPDWRALPAGLPSGVTLVLRRSLARDRRDRLRDIGDARFLLDDLAAAPVADGPPRKAAMRRREGVAWVLSALLLAALGGTLLLRPRPSTPSVPTRFSFQPPESVLLTGGGNQISAVLSPDGRRLVFVAVRGGQQALWLRDFSAPEAERLAGTDRAFLPFWSSDGRAIGFFADGQLRAVDVAGGTVRSICDAVGAGGAWSRDGVIVFGGVDGLSRVAASGGPVEPLARLGPASKATSYRFPSFLPDGRRFLFSAYPLNQIWLGSIDSAETGVLFAADSQAQFVEPGRIVFARQGTLFAQPFDAARAATSGDAVPIEASVMSDASGYHAFSLSESGQLAYRSGRLIETTQLTWVDRAGRVVGVAGQPGFYRNPALSRDDARVAVEVTDSSQRSQDIWLLELARNVLSRFTFDDGDDVMPVWSPDGAAVVFGSDRRGGIYLLYRKATDMASPETLLQKAPTERSVPYSWSPDGRFILHRFLINNFYNTGVYPLTGDGTSHLYAERSYMLANATVSPDGRLVAYNANDSGRFEVFVESFPTPGARYQVSRDGGVHPRWRRDGREVFYYAPDGQLMAAPISSASTPPVGAAVPLFRARLLNGPNVSVGFSAQYDVASDGRFLLNVPVADTVTPVIHVVLNWAAGLGLDR